MNRSERRDLQNRLRRKYKVSQPQTQIDVQKYVARYRDKLSQAQDEALQYAALADSLTDRVNELEAELRQLRADNENTDFAPDTNDRRDRLSAVD
jgi:predicted ribosome quality control (RQC) complex YloA/Tae2 family protein